MARVPMMALGDGNQMPQLGFGVWQIPDGQVQAAVEHALETGYRSIDTAAIYRNETGVGDAIAASGLPRDEIFVTTKLWNDKHGYDAALRAFDESLSRLRTDWVDLYLIHWPVPARGRYVEAWKALVRLKEEGRARSIGVSNFHEAHLERIVGETGVVPAVNQVELHPLLQQRALRVHHAARGIVTEAWSPLGQGTLFEEPVLASIAQKHRRTVAQIVLRWHLQSGVVAIPKSVTPTRIEENFQVFDFELDPDDLRRILALDRGRRIGGDPETFGAGA